MLSEALAAVRGDIEALGKDGSGHNNHYTTLPSILIAVNPILAKHNLSILIDVPEIDRGEKFTQYKFQVKLSCETESEICYFWIPEARVPRGKSQSEQDELSKRIQDFGATVTYGSRYIYSALLGVPSSDEDPDGTTGKVTVEDLTWWFATVPNHEASKELDGEKLFNLLKLFTKGQITREAYEKRGIK